MKALYFFLFLVCTYAGFSQKDQAMWPSLGLQYSQRFLAGDNMSQHLNSVHHLQFGGPLSYVGVFNETYLLIARGGLNHNTHLSYDQLLPQTVRFNDTATGTLRGFNVSFSIYSRTLLPKSKYFQIIVYGGMDVGRLCLYEQAGHFQKNPYFMPKLRFSPMVDVWKLRCWVAAEYAYDLGGYSWRKGSFSQTVRYALPKTSMTGLNLSFGLGYVFADKAPRSHKKSGIRTE